jgi:hypothetical protein
MGFQEIVHPDDSITQLFLHYRALKGVKAQYTVHFG